jgi:hypothetical protein
MYTLSGYLFLMDELSNCRCAGGGGKAVTAAGEDCVSWIGEFGGRSSEDIVCTTCVELQTLLKVLLSLWRYEFMADSCGGIRSCVYRVGY